MPLVELEHADEERARALGERRRLGQERLQVHERGEDRRGLDAELADQPRREVGDRADRVDAANRPDGDAVRERVEQVAHRRAVEARRGPPVAVDVEHDRHAAAREASARERERGLVRALDEQDRRPEAPDLARDAQREERVERRAVERAHRERRDELEDPVASRSVVDGAAEHAHVEHVRERVELEPERVVERQPVARPPDQQQAVLHDAARSRIRSSSS